MTLPVGVATKTVTIAVPMDVLGDSAKAYSGTVKTDRPLVWAATGDPIWPVPADLPAPVDGLITFDVPVVDQAGMLDANGAPITDWSYSITLNGTWSSALRVRSRKFQVVTADASPVALDVLLDAGVNPPVVDPDPYVQSIAGVTGVVTGVQLANAVGARVDAGDSSMTDAIGDAVAAAVEGHTPGIDLGSAVRTTNFTTTAAASSDAAGTLPGFSVTVVGKGRPVDLRFHCASVRHSVANTAVSVVLIRDGNVTGADNQIGAVKSASTTDGPSLTIVRRTGVLLDGVSYTFTARAWGAVAGTCTLVGASFCPIQMTATAV